MERVNLHCASFSNLLRCTCPAKEASLPSCPVNQLSLCKMDS